MRKRNSSGYRPLLYAILCFFLIIHTGACNQTSHEPDVPAVSLAPTATEAPTPTVIPVTTDAPATTEAPQSTEKPVPTVAPQITETPDMTEAPTTTNTPIPTVTPAHLSPTQPTVTPTITEAPTPLPVPVFSDEGGFYDNAFNLSLSSDKDTAIYYTKDGSDPRTSATALLYTNAIPIYDNTDSPNVYSAVKDISLPGYQPPQFNVDKGIVIRAVAKTETGEYGDVISNSYFVGKSASYYTDLKVISMVTDSDYLFHPDTGAYMTGSGYYKWRDSSDYIAYDPGDVQNPTNYNADGKESEFPVSIQVFENGASVYSANVGARISGNWSRSAAQKSIRFYARKEYGTKKMNYAFFDDLTDTNGKLIKKFDKVTLRNGGNDNQSLHFRDALIQDLTRGLALDYMASEPYILFINGEFWGFYLLREKPEDYYIQSHYGIDEKDVAVIKNGVLESGSENDLGDYWNFCNWAAAADMTQEKNYKEFCARMDIQSFMDYITVETYVNNNDWANGYVNNWIVWRSNTVNPELPKADGKWRFILYDLDMSSGLYGSNETASHYDSLNTIYSESEHYNLPDILRNLSKNKEFLQAFCKNYIRIVDTCFAPDKVNETLDAYMTAYGDATKASFLRFGIDWAASNYENEFSNIRSFFEQRPEYAKRYLNSFGERRGEVGGASGNTPVPEDPVVANTARWTYYGTATFSANQSDNSFQVTVPQTTQNSWDIQSQTPRLTLEKGCTYRLSFDASYTGNGKFDMNINRFDGTGYPNCFWAGATLSEELKNYEFIFVMNDETHTDWKLCFNYGSGQGTFLIRNVTLAKID